MIEAPILIVATDVERRNPNASHLGSSPVDLLGVNYYFKFADEFTELPLCIDYLWLYVRLHLAEEFHESVQLGLVIYSHDYPGYENKPKRVKYGDQPEREPFDLGVISNRYSIQSRAYKLSNIEIPCLGRYEFRLLRKMEEPDWKGRIWTILSKSFIEIR